MNIHYCACCHQRVAWKNVTRIHGLGFVLNACPKHTKILEDVKEHLANRLYMYRCNENKQTK
jgi:hypothetical protein